METTHKRQLTASLLCVYGLKSATSNPGGNPLLLGLLVLPPSPPSPCSRDGVVGCIVSRNLAPTLCALLLIANSPSSPGGEALVAEPGGVDLSVDLPEEGARSFQRATMLRTEARGERGEVCGRRRADGGVRVPVPVRVSAAVGVLVGVSVKVLVNVLVKVLGLR